MHTYVVTFLSVINTITLALILSIKQKLFSVWPSQNMFADPSLGHSSPLRCTGELAIEITQLEEEARALILALQRLRQEHFEFKPGHGYIVRSCLTTN